MQGLADLCCAMHLPYESAEAVRIDGEVMETIYHGALEASAELAETEGPYEHFEGAPMARGDLQFDLWEQTGPKPALSGRWDWAALKERIRASGARNSLVSDFIDTRRGPPVNKVNKVGPLALAGSRSRCPNMNHCKSGPFSPSLQVTALMPTASTSQILGNAE